MAVLSSGLADSTCTGVLCLIVSCVLCCVVRKLRHVVWGRTWRGPTNTCGWPGYSAQGRYVSSVSMKFHSRLWCIHHVQHSTAACLEALAAGGLVPLDHEVVTLLDAPDTRSRNMALQAGKKSSWQTWVEG